ncbi:MAG: ferritin-like domain-containing protein [Chitinophagaceae bacterium]|nr:MAG: ferritin-like domain-containing protein [Chitinophagaceae bacterium]
MDPNAVAPNGQASSSIDSMMHRRKFLLFSGAAASAALVGVACKKSDDPVVTPTPSNAVDLGTGDTGVLNYAYALEQLEAAFYLQVMATPFTGMTSTETEYLSDIRDHEVAHRDFFKAALGNSRIQDLTPNFSSVNFASRDSVLATAKAFEDLGVAAYNGAGKLLTSADYLLLAGKIVSVEARHAALIRDLISNGTFADLPSLASLGADNSKGLDAAQTPAQVLQIANSFLRTPVSGANLPS